MLETGTADQSLLVFAPGLNYDRPVFDSYSHKSHRDFVNWCESSKNFVNVLKTLSNKNQKKMASRLVTVLSLFAIILVSG